MQSTQRLDDNEHTYVGRDFPPPTPAHLSARLVPTQLQPLQLLSVSSGTQHPCSSRSLWSMDRRGACQNRKCRLLLTAVYARECCYS